MKYLVPEYRRTIRFQYRVVLINHVLSSTWDYENTEGIQIETFWKKYSARLNSEYDLLNGRLKVGENLELNYMNYREANHTQLAANEPPIIPVYTETGGWGGASLDVGMDDYRNPVKDHLFWGKTMSISS